MSFAVFSSKARHISLERYSSEQTRSAVRYRGYLWSANYDSRGEVVQVSIPYTVKTGGWFTGLGKGLTLNCGDWVEEHGMKERVIALGYHREREYLGENRGTFVRREGRNDL